MSRVQQITGVVTYEVYSEETTLHFGVADETKSYAVFNPVVFQCIDGVPVHPLPDQRSIEVDGQAVSLPERLPLMMAEDPMKEYFIPDSPYVVPPRQVEGGWMVTKSFTGAAMKSHFHTQFEEDQAARLAEVE